MGGMMRLPLFLWVWLLVPFFGFAQEAEEGPRDLARRFEGTLGKNLGITLLLAEREREDGSLDYLAAYHYHRNGVPITLAEDEGGEGLRFREVAGYRDGGEERITGRWSIVWDEGTITGTWTSADGKKKLPIALKESYPAGSVRVEQVKLDFSCTEQTGGRRSGHQRDLMLLRVPEKGAKALNSKLALLARDAVDEERKLAPTVEAIAQHLRAQVRAPIDAESPYVSSRSEDFQVRMNEGGFLTVEHASYAYEGGAHGNYASVFHTLEIESGRAVKLAELVQPGFEKKWAALGAAELRKTYGLGADASLKEAGLFEDELELTENWFLVPGGIGFHYSPYEIGPYAMGSIEFVLPWKDILAELKPGTKVHATATQMAATQQ